MTNNVQYERCWRNKFLTTEAKTIDDMINIFEEVVKEFKQMKADGITLREDVMGGISDDYATLITDDPKVAEKYGFELELTEDEE